MKDFNAPLAPRIVSAIVLLLFVAGSVLSALWGRDPHAFQRLVNAQDDAYGRYALTMLETRQFGALERTLDPNYASGARASLEELAGYLDRGTPQSTDVVGYNVNVGSLGKTVTLSYQVVFPDRVEIVSVLTTRNGSNVVLEGLHVTPIPKPLEAGNGFTLSGQTPVHYLWLLAMAFVGITTLGTFVACAWLPYVRRRWLWMVLVLVGLVQFSMNWTTGDINITPITFLVPGIGWRASGPYAPWILSFTLPLGAACFWWFKANLTTRPLAQAVYAADVSA